MDIWEALREARARLLKSPCPPLAAPEGERRGHPRLATDGLAATVFTSESEHPAEVRDLSLTGACLAGAPDGLSEGQPVVIAVHLGRFGQLVAACDVIYASDTDPSRTVGVRFLALDPESTSTLFFYLHYAWERAADRGGWEQA